MGVLYHDNILPHCTIRLITHSCKEESFKFSLIVSPSYSNVLIDDTATLFTPVDMIKSCTA